MKEHCNLCGTKLEEDRELRLGICNECLRRGFKELQSVLGEMQKKGRDSG
ncbi:MAG: hypothetical protein SVU32_05510 [Candidatus Nanohaloarchaea archaeon]|nr:hypothetical protein [Candidatus Nanohaloarchaea archaeon]